MKMFTVIGFWTDSRQRFTESAVAKTAELAEKLIGSMNPGLTVVATILGDHDVADKEVYIREFFE